MKIKITKEYEYYTGFGYFSLKEGEVYNVRSGSPNDDVILIDLGRGACVSIGSEFYTQVRETT